MPTDNPTVIWAGEVFDDGQRRDGRVVRCPPDGDLVFEVNHGQAAMSEPIWRRRPEPFFEFLRAAGSLMEAARVAQKVLH